MRWAFINPIKTGSWGGMENWMLRLACAMKTTGDEVLVIGRPASAWPERCRQHGLACAPYSFGGDFAPLAVPRLRRILAGFRPDAICAKGFRQARFCRRAWPKAGIAVKLPMPDDVKDGLIDRWTIRWAMDRIIADSHASRLHFLRFPWLDPAKVVTVHNGFTPACPYPDLACRSALRRALGLPEEALVVAAAGRFTTAKRFTDAIAAFSEARLPAPAALVLIGDGPERTAQEAQARLSTQPDPILFTGWRDDAETLLHGADILLHPSGYEGFPNVVMEAMAAGVVPIATDAAGTPELVRDGVDGFIVPVGDHTAMRSALIRVAADPTLRQRMAREAADRVRTTFTLANMTAGVRATLLAITRPPASN